MWENYDLKDIKKHFDSIVFVSYLTIEPNRESVNDYVDQMKQELEDDTTQLWFTGRMATHIDPTKFSEKLLVFNSIESLVAAV